MKVKVAFYLLISVLFTAMANATPIKYRLSMPNPHTHYFEVEIIVPKNTNSVTLIKMPVWTPGSYLIREYAGNTEGQRAEDPTGKPLKVLKINKNTWQVDNSNNAFSFKYSVYANELKVRNAHLDISHAYINNAAVFCWVAGTEKAEIELEIIPFEAFKKISTALQPISVSNPWHLKAEDLDTFYDSPIEIGNQDIFSFQASGVIHNVAIYGPATYSKLQLQTDMQRICNAAASVVAQKHPSPNYTFIIHNMPDGSGGLEHKNSCTLQAFGMLKDPANPKSYNNFLALVAHEYFHLWNVKRIRPIALGPFNYEAENYTTGLWVAEGFTSYYDDYIVYKAGLITEEDYLNIVDANISNATNSVGARYQSIAESSFDAWIKFYRPNENSGNANVSYYGKGGVVATMLNFQILEATNGKKNLDDVLRALYTNFYLAKNVGFTDQDLLETVNKVADKDFGAFFNSFVYGKEMPDCEGIMAKLGLELENKNIGRKKPWLGARTTIVDGKCLVTSTIRNSPAYLGGLYVGDNILAINNKPLVGGVLSIADYKPTDAVEILLQRRGASIVINLKLGIDPDVNYFTTRKAYPNTAETVLLNAWLKP